MSHPPDGSTGGTTSGDPGDSVYESLVSLIAELLEANVCEFLVERDDRLVVRASSDPRPNDPDRSYPIWTGLPGRAYSTGTSCIIDDSHDTRSAASTETGQLSSPRDYRSLCCVPMDGHGLLLVKAVQPGAFTTADRELAEQVCGMVRSAPDRGGTDLLATPDGGRDSRDYPELLDEIADILSHDLKNPLSLAYGNLELAREAGGDEHAEKAARALNRVETLVDEVVSLARTGKYVEEKEVVDLEEQAVAAWESVQTENADLQIEGTIEFNASERGVRHMLENIIDNAVKHSGPEVTVRVGALDEGFYIEDDGAGIPEPVREKIFDRGYSLESETSGLGLHIVKRIADAHGWSLSVEESTAGGTRFEVAGIDVQSA